MNNERVVITGGAGFIGSHLADTLIKDNEVIIIDDLSTGRISNIASILNMKNMSLIRGSILDKELLEKSFKKVDYVFHEAALPSVSRSIENPILTNEVNVNGTLNVLIAAINNKVKKVVCASSSSVFGDTPTLPKREEMTPNPRSPYALTKLIDEYYSQLFHNIYGLSTICLRYFNVYGPRQNPNSQYSGVIPRFIKMIQEGKPPIIFGDGKQTRDFTFVLDVVQANIMAAETSACGVFNIGSGSNVSIEDLAKLIINSMNKTLSPTYNEVRVGDVRNSLADITKAKEIGYRPEYSLEKGLKETIRNFENGS